MIKYVAGVLIALGFFAYWGMLLMSESVYCHRGSIQYHLLIHDDPIRDFPTFDDPNPTYIYSASDGPRSSSNEVFIRSSMPKDDLARMIATHLASHKQIVDMADTKEYAVGDCYVSVSVHQDKGGGSWVSVSSVPLNR